MMKSTKINQEDFRNSALRSLKAELQTRESELNKVQALFSDISHAIEGAEKLNAVQWYFHAKAVAKVQRVRRPIKKRIIVLERMIAELEKPNGSIDKALEIGKKLEKEMEGNILKYYKFRHLKNTDFKKFNILHETEEALKRLKLDSYEEEYEREY